jgi:hypothetical protein
MVAVYYLSRLRSSGRGPLVTALLIIAFTPRIAAACACGCGVFEVGTSSLFPSGPGGQVWLQYEYMDQYIDHRATEPASAGA